MRQPCRGCGNEDPAYVYRCLNCGAEDCDLCNPDRDIMELTEMEIAADKWSCVEPYIVGEMNRLATLPESPKNAAQIVVLERVLSAAPRQEREAN